MLSECQSNKCFRSPLIDGLKYVNFVRYPYYSRVACVPYCASSALSVTD